MHNDLATKIAEEYGYEDAVDAVEAEGWAIDSVVPGACIKCEEVVDSCEPDAYENYCEECEGGFVKSILVLLGIL